MTPPRRATFLARDGYRLRRLMDAARCLPAFGLVLLLLPLMREDPGAQGSPATAGETVYLFAVWLALIVATFAMARGLRRALRPPPPPGSAGPDA